MPLELPNAKSQSLAGSGLSRRSTSPTSGGGSGCLCVFDSTWEATEAFELDRNPNVEAWVKNDHLGFEILYVSKGVVRKYWPDYLIRMKDGSTLVLEVKGQDSQESQTKREFLDEWVRAVNAQGGFGRWRAAVSHHPKDVAQVLLI